MRVWSTYSVDTAAIARIEESDDVDKRQQIDAIVNGSSYKSVKSHTPVKYAHTDVWLPLSALQPLEEVDLQCTRVVRLIPV